MRNRNLSLAFLCFLLVLQYTYAQISLSVKDEQIFKENVSKKAALTTSIESEFIQEKHLSVLDNVVVSKGNMVFLAPDKIRWQYNTPYISVAIFKDNKLYTYYDGKKNTTDLNSNKIFKNFNQLLINSINGNMFDEAQFDVSYFKTNLNYIVRFVPKEKKLKKIVSEFELTFNEKSLEVEQIKLFDSSADFTFIKFINRKNNEKVLQSSFQL